MKYGYAEECQACTQLAAGMHNAKVHHDDRCRECIGKLIVSSRAVPEVEIPRPGARDELDVGETTVRVDAPPVPPVPTWVDPQVLVQEQMK